MADRRSNKSCATLTLLMMIKSLPSRLAYTRPPARRNGPERPSIHRESNAPYCFPHCSYDNQGRDESRSKTLPTRGRPTGPGGNGSPSLSRRRRHTLRTNATQTTKPAEYTDADPVMFTTFNSITTRAFTPGQVRISSRYGRRLERTSDGV